MYTFLSLSLSHTHTDTQAQQPLLADRCSEITPSLPDPPTRACAQTPIGASRKFQSNHWTHHEHRARSLHALCPVWQSPEPVYRHLSPLSRQIERSQRVPGLLLTCLPESLTSLKTVHGVRGCFVFIICLPWRKINLLRSQLSKTTLFVYCRCLQVNERFWMVESIFNFRLYSVSLSFSVCTYSCTHAYADAGKERRW